MAFETYLDHLQNGLVLGLDALQEAGLGELERDVGVGELVVRLGGGVLLDKLGQVAAVGLELAALVVENVGADAVEEAAVWRTR